MSLDPKCHVNLTYFVQKPFKIYFKIISLVMSSHMGVSVETWSRHIDTTLLPVTLNLKNQSLQPKQMDMIWM